MVTRKSKWITKEVVESLPDTFTITELANLAKTSKTSVRHWLKRRDVDPYMIEDLGGPVQNHYRKEDAPFDEYVKQWDKPPKRKRRYLCDECGKHFHR